MLSVSHLITCLLLIFASERVLSQPNDKLDFKEFLKPYLAVSGETLEARRNLARAERDKVRATDQWKSRLTATPQLSFEEQSFDGGSRPNNSNRTSNVTAQLSQMLPSGTQLEISGQKFIETPNPIYSALDRSYSAKITQDLFRNAFGKTQRAQSNQGRKDFELASLQFRQSIVNSCETAFNLYADAFVQQEITDVLKIQFRDAKKALGISRRLYRDKLIDRVDRLASENDFINTQLQVEQAEQRLVNIKRQILAFLPEKNLAFRLTNPSQFLTLKTPSNREKTLSESLLKTQLESQKLRVEQARSERWTDIQLGLEAGEKFGRGYFNGPLENFNEEYLRASITFGFDLVNNSENATLKNALYRKNSLVKEQVTLEQTQRARVDGLVAMGDLLKTQLKSSETQVKLLEEKMDIAFTQMKRAKLDFQNYLLHRNAYLNQQRNFLNLQKDYWSNQIAIQKEYAHTNPQLCEVSS